MRLAAFGIGMLLISTPALAQTPCSPQTVEYDPYKPSHLAIMREYGGTILAQAPLSTLLKLDPYVPSQGELLRQLGRGIPLWTAHAWYPYAPASVTHPAPPGADCEPAAAAVRHAPSAPPITSFAEVARRVERQRAAATDSPTITLRPTSSGERNRGLLINYAGRTWVSAGAAVPLREPEFRQIGESAGFPIFGRSDMKEDVIFVPTTEGMVAPFRILR